MDELNRHPEQHSNVLSCPDCGHTPVSTMMQTQEIVYGTGSQSATVLATYPVRHCDACGFTYTDREAEEARHEAVCCHLRVMTPRQIRQLRELNQHSQASFAELTGLGTATISRWERGALIQNRAYDNYLYLLGFADNLHRLQERARRPAHPDLTPSHQRFRALRVTERLLNRQREFRLTVHT